MSDKADKRKPLAESIAVLFGATSFRSEFGGSGYSQDMPKEAIVRALGWVQQEQGSLPVWCMETFYAGTLRHEKPLMRSYLALGEPKEAHDKAIGRLTTALAIRSLAGQRYTPGMLEEYDFLLCCRKGRTRTQMATAEAWFNDHLSRGLREFKERIHG
jgi:hypothetical protein